MYGLVTFNRYDRAKCGNRRGVAMDSGDRLGSICCLSSCASMRCRAVGRVFLTGTLILGFPYLLPFSVVIKRLTELLIIGTILSKNFLLF